MKTDNSYKRYIESGNERYDYAVSHLFGEVLDIGCGDGYGIYLMNKQSGIKKITGIDNQTEAIQKAKINLKGIDAMILKADAENIPFSVNSFDSVHCGQTLEHVRDDKKVLSEIYRVTKKRAVFSVPIHGGISTQHVREYNSLTITELLKEYFNIISVKMFAGRYDRLVIVAEK